VRRLGALELGQQSVEQQRRAGAEGRRHLARERFAEACLGAPPGGEAGELGRRPRLRIARRERGEDRRDAVADGAQADRRQRLRIGSQGETLRALGARKGGARDFVPIVVLGRHPEDGDRRLAAGAERLGVAHRGGRLDETEERAAEQTALLAGDDDARRRVGEPRGELGGARMAVRGVGDTQRGGELATLDRRRRAVGQLAGGEEAQRREQIAVAPGDELARQAGDQAGGETVDIEGVGGAHRGRARAVDPTGGFRFRDPWRSPRCGAASAG
jgi:hypothetical protein